MSSALVSSPVGRYEHDFTDKTARSKGVHPFLLAESVGSIVTEGGKPLTKDRTVDPVDLLCAAGDRLVVHFQVRRKALAYLAHTSREVALRETGTSTAQYRTQYRTEALYPRGG